MVAVKLLDKHNIIYNNCGVIDERKVWESYGSPKGKCIIAIDGTFLMTTMEFRDYVHDYTTPLDELIEQCNDNAEPLVPLPVRKIIESLKGGKP